MSLALEIMLKSALEGTLNPLRTNGLLPHPKLPSNAALRFQVQVSPVIKKILYYYNVALLFATKKNYSQVRLELETAELQWKAVRVGLQPTRSEGVLCPFQGGLQHDFQRQRQTHQTNKDLRRQKE